MDKSITPKEHIYRYLKRSQYSPIAPILIDLLKNKQYDQIPWNVLDDVLVGLDGDKLYVSLITELTHIDSSVF
ncbi:hypothetical protein QTN25_001252 [Entamoeba marina]